MSFHHERAVARLAIGRGDAQQILPVGKRAHIKLLTVDARWNPSEVAPSRHAQARHTRPTSPHLPRHQRNENDIRSRVGHHIDANILREGFFHTEMEFSVRKSALDELSA